MSVSVFNRITRRLAQIVAAVLAGPRAILGLVLTTSTVVPDGAAPAPAPAPATVDGPKTGPSDGFSAHQHEEGEAPPRICILDVRPAVDGGRFPIKRTVGDRVEVSAEAFRDGHDAIRVVLRYL